MNNGLLIICFCCSVLSGILVLLLTSYYCKLKDRVDDLEKQLNTIVCNLVSYEKYYNSGLNELKNEIEKINDDLDAHCYYDSFKFNLFEEKLYKSPHLVFFSKRRDKNG